MALGQLVLEEFVHSKYYSYYLTNVYIQLAPLKQAMEIVQKLCDWNT